MGVTLEMTKAGSRIEIEGSNDIATAAELKVALQSAVNAAKPVTVSLRSATYLDVTAMQLLWAAERAAKGAGVVLNAEDELSDSVTDVIRDAGFLLFAAE